MSDQDPEGSGLQRVEWISHEQEPEPGGGKGLAIAFFVFLVVAIVVAAYFTRQQANQADTSERAGVTDSVGLMPAMTAVGDRFSTLAQNTDLFFDSTWRAQTVAIVQTAESKARRLADMTPGKRSSLLKLAESLRVIRESTAAGDLVGLSSATRLMTTATEELRR